jgi:hypothetical protein
MYLKESNQSGHSQRQLLEAIKQLTEAIALNTNGES